MAESIVSGLFGLTPPEIRQQQDDSYRAAALEYAKLSPTQRVKTSEYETGQQLGRAGLGMLGIQDNAGQQAQTTQDLQRQIDHSTPEGLMQGAQLFNQAGNPRMAFMYQQAAAAKDKERQELLLTKAQTEKETALAKKATKEEDLTKYGRLQRMEIGVEGKPDYRQQALYDPLSGETKNIGAPYRVPAAISAEAKVGAVAAKEAAKKETGEAALSKLDVLVSSMEDTYNELNKLGAIPSTAGGIVGNVAAYAAGTGPGQVIGSAIGTKAQELRNDIRTMRPALAQALAKASGMSAKQLDTNRDMQMLLDQATDVKFGYEANMKALDRIRKMSKITPNKTEGVAPKRVKFGDLK